MSAPVELWLRDKVTVKADPARGVGEILEFDGRSGFFWVRFGPGEMGWYKEDELQLVARAELEI